MKLEALKRLNNIKKIIDADQDIADMLGNPGSLAELDAALQENAEIAEIISDIMGNAAGAAKKPVAQKSTGNVLLKGKPGYKVCPAGLHLIGVRAESCKECNGVATPIETVSAPEAVSAATVPVSASVTPEPYPEPTKALTQAAQKHYNKLLDYHVTAGRPLTRTQLVAELAVWLAQIMEQNINNK